MFGTNSYMTIWEVNDKGNYAEVSLSSTKKNKQTGKNEQDFGGKFVRFVGDAYLQRPMPNQRIKLTGCGVQNAYVKDGKTQYLKNPTYIVWSYDLQESLNNETTPATRAKTIDDYVSMDEDIAIPF